MRILLPTDYSENSWHAIQYAVYLFEETESKFYIMHAHQSGPSALVSTINKERDTRLHQITQDEAVGKLYKMVAQLKKINKNKNHHYEPVLESESLIQSVGRHVIDKDVDYIVMGTQGASGLKEVFLGSNTVKILKNINFCPLLAVPHDYLFSRPSSIAFATDYKHEYLSIEMKPLLDILHLWNATLRIIHVRTDEVLDEAQNKLQQLLFSQLGSIQYTHEELEYHPTLAYRINEWAMDQDINMLAMFNTSRGFFRKLLREPVLKKIAFKTQMPFLVLPEATRSG